MTAPDTLLIYYARLEGQDRLATRSTKDTRTIRYPAVLDFEPFMRFPAEVCERLPKDMPLCVPLDPVIYDLVATTVCFVCIVSP
jgi:hypothetical protein